MIHIHTLVDGFGGMGDGYVCGVCNFESYSRPLFSRLIKNDGRAIHSNEFPHVRWLPEEVTWESDWSTWTHFMNKDGEIEERPRSKK